MNRLEYETKYRKEGYINIAGCDEAGRGPIAGPLVVASVMFEEGYYDERINDSKKLTEKKREELYDVIIQNAKCYAIKVWNEKEVDELNVYQASKLGMIECINQLSTTPDFTLTDAMPLGDEYAHLAIVKGDSISISIAAASILAKVTRDRMMLEYDQLYPQYNFKQHKGYPTKAHLEALKQYGACPIHRQSFGPVKNLKMEQLSFDLFEAE